MPIFEYRCGECGEILEVLEKTHKPSYPTCPNCKTPSMKKLLSGFSVGVGKPENPPCGNCPGIPCGSEGCGVGSCPMV
ncbi:zinc ribbon domain-containing protein [Planctomycetota bacterium]